MRGNYYRRPMIKVPQTVLEEMKRSSKSPGRLYQVTYGDYHYLLDKADGSVWRMKFPAKRIQWFRTQELVREYLSGSIHASL